MQSRKIRRMERKEEIATRLEKSQMKNDNGYWGKKEESEEENSLNRSGKQKNKGLIWK